MEGATTATEVCAATPAQARFGALLRLWRVRAAFTQAGLAATLRYSPALISRLEAGTRKVTVAFARSADELLGANGELVELAVRIALDGRGEPDAPPAQGPRAVAPVPLPATALGGRDFDLAEVGRQPLRPTGLVCPLHGEVHRRDLDLAREAAQSPRTASVHAYHAWLAAHIRLSLESVHLADVVALVERMLAVVVGRVHAAAPAKRTGLLHLAADFAALAGRMRSDIGQPSAATAWLSRAVSWGAASGNVCAQSRSLCTMSLISLLEGDFDSAAKYAGVSRDVDPSRRWTIAHGFLWSARAAAARGDHTGFDRFVAAYEQSAARFGDRDRAEAPWLVGDEGQTYLNSAIAGGLRDLAIRTGSRALAARAATSARAALASLPPAMRPTYLLLAVRYADCLARAGHPDAATKAMTSVLASARTIGSSLVQHELSLLDSALDDLVGGRP